MQIGLYQSVSGMKAMEAYQNDLSANLARQSIVGARSTITAFELFEEVDRQKKNVEGPIKNVGNKALPLVAQSVVNFSQGPLLRTGDELNFAIQGNAFFAVQEPGIDGRGVVRYTRGGQFSLDSQGRVITPDGAQALLEGGVPFEIDPRGNRNINVRADGTVYVGDNPNPVGRLALVHFDDPRQALQTTSSGRFEAIDQTLVKDGPTEFDRVEQGFVEGSNANSITEMVNLIQVMRTYEANQRAVAAMDETNGRLINSITAV